MKKNMYIIPAIKIVEIKANNVLAGSLPGQNVYDTTADKSKGTLSRETRFSDGDWDEE